LIPELQDLWAKLRVHPYYDNLNLSVAAPIVEMHRLRQLLKQVVASGARNGFRGTIRSSVGSQIVPGSVASGGAAAHSKASVQSGATPRETFVQANGHRFFVLSSGDSKGKPLLCLPGAMGTATTDFPNQLSAEGALIARGGYHVISFDPRGYGKSRPPTRRFPLDFYHRDADDAAAIMDELVGKGVSYDVLGWSDGANSGVILASKHPDRVDKLAIFGGNGYVTEHDIQGFEATRDVHKSWSKRMLETHLPIYGEELQSIWGGFCDAMKAIFDNDGDICQKEAKALRCPTLVLHGEKDPLVPGFQAKWFVENIPNAQSYNFPDGKHNIHIRFAAEFDNAVLKFFRGDSS